MATALRVLLPLPLPAFSFLPPSGQLLPVPGMRVAVPWQQGVRLGFVVGEGDLRRGEGLELRHIITVLDTEPFLKAPALQLIDELATRTCSPPGLVLRNLLAVGLSDPTEHQVRAVEGTQGSGLKADGWVPASDLPAGKLDWCRRQGVIHERVVLVPETVRVLVAQRAAGDELDGAQQANQRRALEYLEQREYVESAAALSRQADVPESAARALVRKGYARYELVSAPAPALPWVLSEDIPPATPSEKLPESELISLSGGTRRARLQVLARRAQREVRAGHQVLVLVPEQAMLEPTARELSVFTPTLMFRTDASDRERHRLFEELASGAPLAVVGGYLSLLAPFTSLSCIVVVGEGSASYKLLFGCRAHVPIAARLLAAHYRAELVLEDALVSAESQREVPATARVQLPQVRARLHTVDLAKSRNWPLCAELIRFLKQVAERDRQAVLLVSRRGFSAALQCSACGFVAMCPHCDLPLRYHRGGLALRCHQCGHKQAALDACPACGKTTLEPARAAGTEWMMTLLAELFPALARARIDSDVRDDLGDFYAGKPGVVVATTALLRHPPLPNVSLIALTLFDGFLQQGDFRADEDAYRLLLQLPELAPERRPLILLQTFQTNHEVLRDYREGDTEGFMSRVLERRQRYQYPPFSVMAKVQLSAKTVNNAEREARWLASALRTQGASEDELLGPTPAPVARAKGRYHYQLFLRCADYQRVQTLLRPALAYRGAARLRIDVDPREIGGLLD